MNLKTWCSKNEWNHKVLLTDNKTNVSRLKRIANESGYIIKNLDDYRMEDLAKIIVIEKKANEKSFVPFVTLDTDESALLVNQIILSDPDAFSAFPKECLGIESSNEILRVMNIIRMGSTTRDYGSLSNERENQTKKLIDRYEEKLENENLYDKVRLLKDATIALNEKKVRVDYSVGIFKYMESRLTFLEKSFLHALSNDPVWIDCNRDSKVEAKFYKTYGQSNEIQAVIKEIEEKKLAFGKVSILYSSKEYLTGIIASLEEKGINYSITTGHNIKENPYVSLLLALIKWAKNDYSYEAFKDIANHVLIRLSKDYSFGVKVGIGWGLDRYKKFIDLMRNDIDEYKQILIKHKVVSIKDDENGNELPLCSDGYLEVIEKLIGFFDEISHSPYNMGDIYNKVLILLKDIVGKTNKDNNTVYTELKHMRNFFYQYGEVETFDEVLRVLENTISTMEVSDEEATDAVSIIHINRMEVIERPYLFCIGLSYEGFSSKVSDSPVISDERLLELLDQNKGYIEKATERNKVKKDNLLESINTMPDGNLYISACEYDAINFRKLALSEVYMELMKKYNIIEEDVINVEYSHIPDCSVEYKIDKKSLFLKEIPQKSEEKEVEDQEETEEEKDNKENKEKKEKKKNSGYVIEEKDGDHTVIRIPRLSSSMLQVLMSCPWKFDYSTKLYIKNNPEKDVTKWLKPDSKGSFFHQVFQEYFDTLNMKGPFSPEDEIDENMLRSVYDRAIYEFEILVPKGSDQAYEMEKALMWEQIYGYINSLYRDLKNDDKGWYVKDCERDFTSRNYCIDSEGNKVEEDTSCDRIIFSFKGFIDRVDSYTDDDGKEHVRIVDYKTGKVATVDENIKKNIELQHIIYSMTTDEDVESFSFVFPCDNNKVINIQVEEITELPDEVCKKMADVLLGKKYQLLEEDDDSNDSYSKSPCNYCDYKEICVHKMGLE